jgi:hypothetical protein
LYVRDWPTASVVKCAAGPRQYRAALGLNSHPGLTGWECRRMRAETADHRNIPIKSPRLGHDEPFLRSLRGASFSSAILSQ